MANNIYLTTDGRFYSSPYPFSVNDSLIPIVTAGFAAFLNSQLIKPNPTQNIIYLQNYMTDGTIRNGLVSATPALDAALLELREYGGTLIVPPGDYKLEKSGYYWPGTTIKGDGSGAVRFFTTDKWSEPYAGAQAFLASFNDADISTIGYTTNWLDGNVLIEGITFDYRQKTTSSPNGGKHAIRAYALKGVTVQNCTFYGGEDCTAMLNCDGTAVVNNFGYDQTNCFWDHWTTPQNALVANNFAKTTVKCNQGVNFNPERGGPLYGTGHGAIGLVCIGNTVIGSPTDTLPWQLEPLHTQNYCRNMIVTNNKLTYSYIIARGLVTYAKFSQNVCETAGGNASHNIVCHGWGGVDEPDLIEIDNNIIFGNDPGNPFGNIRLELDDNKFGSARNNQIANSVSFTNGIYTTGKGMIVDNNAVQNGLISSAGFVTTKQDLLVPNGKSIGWRSLNGYQPRIVLQSDNNLIFKIVGAAGADRSLFSIFVESDNSDMIISPIIRMLNGMKWETDTIAATGTTISTATTLAGFNVINSCTAGVNDGVALPQSDGKLTVVMNDTAAVAKVYPNNSGAGRIDGGAVSAPVTLNPGQIKGFWKYGASFFKTVFANP